MSFLTYSELRRKKNANGIEIGLFYKTHTPLKQKKTLNIQADVLHINLFNHKTFISFSFIRIK